MFEKWTWRLLATLLLILYFVQRYGGGVALASGSQTTFWQCIPVLGGHLGPRNFIRFGSKSFTGVEGALPFYIPVRGSDLITFVTVKEHGRVLHLARPVTGEMVASVPITSYFGTLIGRSSNNGFEYDDAILLPSRKEVLVMHSTAHGTLLTRVDLEKGFLISEIESDSKVISDNP